VDTAPLLERDFARRAGLGWIGKNTMLINKHRGSYFFLGALLLNLELTPDNPHTGFHCGTCTACLDACPTDAFPAPGVLDARRCISYLTIEHRGSMPEDLRSGVGGWLFGCDICQEVCPWNRRDETQPETVDAVEILGLSDAEFRVRFGGSALERTRRRGLVRNAAIVLGNIGDAAALPALRRASADEDEIVREAAAWAIEQIETRHLPG
jgi:epoxyqueuosine reductase